MPRPKTIEAPTKVTLNIPRHVVDAAKEHALGEQVSLSHLVTQLLAQEILGKSVLHVDLEQEEYSALHQFAEKVGKSPKEIISEACRRLIQYASHNQPAGAAA